MLKTVVIFRGVPFTSDVHIDSLLTVEWPENVPDFKAVADASDGALTVDRVFDMHVSEEVRQFCRGVQGMDMRLRFNPDMRMCMLDHEEPIDDATLIKLFKNGSLNKYRR